MRKIVALVVAFAALPVAAQGVARPAPTREEVVWSLGHADMIILTNTRILGGRRSTEHGFRLTNISVRISGASGGGAGNTVITATDGTNTCTFTLPCATSQGTGVYAVAAVNGAGTGCTYAVGGGFTATVTTAGCTTTQPSFTSLLFLGKPL